MRKFLLLLLLLLCLTGCGSVVADTTTPAPRDTPNSARTDFEVIGRVEQVEEEFLVLTLYLYEASGEPSREPQTLASIDPNRYVPGYETRAIQLPQGSLFYRLENGELVSAAIGEIAIGDVVGATSADGSAPTVVLYN